MDRAFRFVTKFGEKGIVNLGKVVPVLGAMIGGGVDVVTTRIIGYNAYKLFMKGEIPTKEEIEKEIAIETEVVDVEGKDVKDIDTESLENAIKNNVTIEEVEGEE